MGQAEMALGTYPLGLALLCASPRHTIGILIGLILTTFSNLSNPVLYLCTYLAAALIRVLATWLLESPDVRFELPPSLRKKITPEGEEAIPAPKPLQKTLTALFSESVCLRMATAGMCSLIIGLYDIIAGGFLYYDLFAALFAIAVCVCAVLVFSVCLEKRIDIVWLTSASEGALLFAFVFSARTVNMLSFPLAPMAAFFFTLAACRMRGTWTGIVASLICGLAYAPLLTPAFLLAALGYLFFYKAEKSTRGVLLAVGAATAWSIYAGGAGMLLSFLPALLLSGTAFTVSERLLSKQKSAGAENEAEEEHEAHIEVGRYRDANERFRGISDAFSSLSEVFYNLSDRFRRPGTLDLRRLCDHSFDRFCTDCPNKSVCWGLEYTETLGSVNELIACLHTRGKVSRTNVADHLLHRCSQMDLILEEINRECAHLTGEMLRNNRTEIFAMDYEAAASIINDALEEDDGEYRFDPETERRVAEYLTDAGVLFGGVTVYGNRRRRILVRGVDIEHAKVSFETLRSDLGELCSSELGAPLFEVENSVSTMVLQAKQKITVASAEKNVSADGGVSGDSVNLFSNRQDYFYALISDGMGAGREAALTSNLCSIFLEKMLRAGNRAGTSLRMLNNMIRSRGADSTRECSSTVDLLELDLMTGEGSFIKGGAAPSFIVRGNVVQRLQAGTVPIGIICTLDVQRTTVSLRPGDLVVMISDGILQRDAECEWITSYLAGAGEQAPEEIVASICCHAAEGEEHDDCSAVALRIGSFDDKRKE